MSRELWLLRHGKSDRDIESSDFDRPLKKRGKRAAKTIGAWMRQQELIPDLILTSPAKRALSTAIRVCEELGVRDAICQDNRLYASDVDSIKSVLSECPKESRRVLLVGHNPELEQLLVELVGSANLSYQNKLMPTAALARLAMPDDWTNLEAGGAKLLAIIYAKTLFDGMSDR